MYERGESQCTYYRGYFDNDQRSQTSVSRRQTHTIDEVVQNNHTLLSIIHKVDPFYYREAHTLRWQFTFTTVMEPDRRMDLGLVKRIYTKAVNRCVLSRAHRMFYRPGPHHLDRGAGR